MSNYKNPDLTPDLGQLIRAALMRGVTIEETEITPEQKQRMQDRIDDLDADPVTVIVTTNCLWCYRPEDDHVDGCAYGPDSKT